MTEAHSKVCRCGGFNESCHYCGGSSIVGTTEHSPCTPEVVGEWFPFTETSFTPSTYHREEYPSAYALDKASYVAASRRLASVIKLSENVSENAAYALAATETLKLIKTGKNRCHFGDLLPAWKRLFKTAYYHDKCASTLRKECVERKDKKPHTDTHSKKAKPGPSTHRPAVRPATLMELRLRELGLVREK